MNHNIVPDNQKDSSAPRYSKPPLIVNTTPPQLSGKPNGPKQNKYRIWIIAAISLILIALAIFLTIHFSKDREIRHTETPITTAEEAIPTLYADRTDIHAPYEGDTVSIAVKHIPTCSATGIPSWADVTILQDSMEITIEPNTSAETREGSFDITNGHTTLTINLYQDAAPPREQITINSMWLTHGDYLNGKTGLTIHADISFTGLSDQMEVLAKFSNEETGSDLWDTEGMDMDYYKRYTPGPERASDLTIFVPYSDLGEDNFDGSNRINARVTLSAYKASEAYATNPSVFAKTSTTTIFNRR